KGRAEGAGPFRVGRTSMIAQHGHHVRHADVARAILEQLPAALAAGLTTRLRVFGVFAQVSGEVQLLPATQRLAGEVKVAAQTRPVRDRVAALEAPGGPAPPARLQPPRLAWVGQNERAIVARRLRLIVSRRPSLAVFLQQRRHHVESLTSRAAALQAQTD